MWCGCGVWVCKWECVWYVYLYVCGVGVCCLSVHLCWCSVLIVPQCGPPRTPLSSPSSSQVREVSLLSCLALPLLALYGARGWHPKGSTLPSPECSLFFQFVQLAFSGLDLWGLPLAGLPFLSLLPLPQSCSPCLPDSW